MPIGLALPRRDREGTKERHARLMLILLKPWQSPVDLHGPGLSWSSEYESFLQTCNERVRRIIDNMQVLHECRDARDDHFASWSKRAWTARMAEQNEEAEQNHIGESYSEEFIHEHLKDIKDYQSENIGRISDTASQCFASVEQSGFFQCSTSSINATEDRPSAFFADKCVHVSGPKDNDMELVWQSIYEQRKKSSKIMFIHGNDTQRVGVTTDSGVVVGNSNLSPLPVAGDTTDWGFSSDRYGTTAESVVAGNAALALEHDVDSNALIKQWNLNAAQCLAF